MAIATSTDSAYVTQISSGGFDFTSDTTWADRGGETAPAPHDLLDASLAACIAMTVRIAADARKTALDRVTVEVINDDENPASSSFHCTVTLEGDLSEKERAGLLRVAHACPISKLLSKTIEIGISEASS